MTEIKVGWALIGLIHVLTRRKLLKSLEKLERLKYMIRVLTIILTMETIILEMIKQSCYIFQNLQLRNKQTKRYRKKKKDIKVRI